MAVTQNTYTGNGSTVLYSFTFPYLETTDIKVSVNGTTTTAYTLANATTIQFNTAPANGAAIRIYRETDDTGVASTFFAGSAIRAQDLNSNFTQTLYLSQESVNEADSATATANSALTNSNTAISTANSAVSTANSAVSTANSAVSTANSASTNASAAVSTANTASSNASAAVSTANAASATAASAVTTANSAVSTANGAVSTANAANSTANTALTAANSAVSTANTASTNASNAVSTANTANTNASTALSTANTASTNASTAVSTANTANTKADQAIAAVSNSINYQLKANVAAIPASPANDTYIEVQDSTGLESFTPLAGKPAGFVGDAGLSVRLRYTTAGTTWNWLNYYANDSDARFLKKTGGTMTGKITLDGNPSANLHPATKQYVDAADATLTSAAAAAQSTANTAVSNAAAAQSTANTAVTNAATAQSTANTAVTNAAAAQATADAALPKAGGTATGNISAPAFIPTGGTAPTNGVYLPAANSVAISTSGAQRVTVDSSGRVGIGVTPSQTLHVKGGNGNQVYVDNDGSQYSGVEIRNNGTDRYYLQYDNTNAKALIGTRSSAPIVFEVNQSERGRWDTSGRLLVGTSSADTSGNALLQVNGSIKGTITSGTAVASTSGTAIDFTGIPSWVKRVTVMLDQVSTNGSGNFCLQLGSGSIDSAASYSYAKTQAQNISSVSAITFSAGTYIDFFGNWSASATASGVIYLQKLTGNTWSLSSNCHHVSGTTGWSVAVGSKNLSGALDRIRITTAGGTDVFDAGTINILYEG